MVLFSHHKGYRLPYHHVYRPGRTIFAETSSPIVFEQVQRAHLLRYTLAQILFSFGHISRLSRSFFGIIPENSLLDKCPYYRSPNTENAPNLPRQLKWAVSTRKRLSLSERVSSSQNQINSGSGIGGDSSSSGSSHNTLSSSVSSSGGSRLRGRTITNFVGCRKTYKRDLLTFPGMVVLYNTLLAWMMFHIEMGASSL